MNETLREHVGFANQVGWFVITRRRSRRRPISSRSRSTRCSPTRRPKPRPPPRRRSSSDFAKQIGDIGAIMVGDRGDRDVLHPVRGRQRHGAVDPRAHQRAGVLKTLGFSDGRDPVAGADRVVRARAARRWRRSGGGVAARSRRRPDRTACCRRFSCRPRDLSSAPSLIVVFGFASGARCRALAGAGGCVSSTRLGARKRDTIMNSLSQIIAVTGVTLRSIPQRLGSSAVAVIGVAGVVIVFTRRAVDRRRLSRGDERNGRSADGHRHARRAATPR